MKENKIITITAVFNLIVAFLKLISGDCLQMMWKIMKLKKK